MRGEANLPRRGRREGCQGEQSRLRGEQGRLLKPLDKPGASLGEPSGVYGPLLVCREGVLDNPRLVHIQSALWLWHTHSTLWHAYSALLQTEAQVLGAEAGRGRLQPHASALTTLLHLLHTHSGNCHGVGNTDIPLLLQPSLLLHADCSLL